MNKQQFTILTKTTVDDLAEFIAARIEEGSYICVVTKVRDIYYDRQGHPTCDWLVIWKKREPKTTTLMQSMDVLAN
jgi:hypothetical protein